MYERREFRDIAAISFLVLITTLFSFWILRQCRLTLINESKDAIYDITVILTNGSIAEIGHIGSGSRRTVILHPEGDSGVTIRFRTPEGSVVEGGFGYITKRFCHETWKVRPDYSLVRVAPSWAILKQNVSPG